MQVMDMTGFRKQFLKDVKEHVEEILPAIVGAAVDTPSGEPVDDVALNSVKVIFDENIFTIEVEEFLDEAERDHSKPYTPEDGAVTGCLKEYKFGDGFTLKIEVGDSDSNNKRLHQMKRDGGVVILPAQGTLALEDGEESEPTEPAAEQPEIPGIHDDQATDPA